MAPQHEDSTPTRLAHIPHWRGLLGTFAVVADEAIREVRSRASVSRQASSADTPFWFTAKVSYESGEEETFNTIDAFKAAGSKIDPASVRGLTVTALSVIADTVANDSYSVTLLANSRTGVTVMAAAPDDAWARGIVQVYREKLAAGEVDEYTGARGPLKLLYLVAAITLGVGLAAALVVSLVIDSTYDLQISILIALLWYMLLFLGAPLVFSLFDVMRNPHVAFIGPDDRLPAPGPVWRVQAWLGHHPVVRKLLEWTMAGAIGAAIAQLLD